MTMLESGQVGMQRDWLENELYATYPKPIILTLQLHYYYFFLFTFLSIFPVVNRLGMVRRLQIYGKTTGLPIFECPTWLASPASVSWSAIPHEHFSFFPLAFGFCNYFLFVRTRAVGEDRDNKFICWEAMLANPLGRHAEIRIHWFVNSRALLIYILPWVSHFASSLIQPHLLMWLQFHFVIAPSFRLRFDA